MNCADITQTLPKDWRYISEGGAAIVFAYGGKPNSSFDGRALRLRKAPRRASQGSDAEEMDTENPSDDEVDDDDSIVEFQDAIISRLIPSEYLQRLDHVRVSKPWLEALVALRNADRPPERMLKDKVDVTKTGAVLAMDLVGHQDLSVEIKVCGRGSLFPNAAFIYLCSLQPKWGFLPYDKHLSSATRLIKTQTCRFCMHSYLKMSQGHPASRHYCPLDLFSGDRSRVTRALQSLWKDWIESDGSLNNFHLFAHGLNIRPSDVSPTIIPVSFFLTLVKIFSLDGWRDLLVVGAVI
jgi:inositol-pentakisphosphate 2-kinase